MEDRLASGLYLEMTDVDLDEYASTRVPALLADPHVLGATWWRNVHRDRDDLPRVLDEFSQLGVFEVDAGFVAPSATAMPHGVHGLHMLRTGRPGQGTISGRPTIGLSLVLISPEEETRAQELRDWADFVHIRHIAEAAVPGYTMITPYVNANSGGHPRFMHFYEMDCRDPERAFKSMTPLVASRMGGSHSDYFHQWANGPSLRIMYVNTFERVGEAR
ncbi:MAG TPA: hypothetical protein VGI86_07610 [Acidimicrobiia bacterium]